MMPDAVVVLAVLAMAGAAYGTKAAGVALLSARRIPPFIRAVLRNAPAAVILALVAPTVVAGGVPMIAGAAVSAAVSVRTRNILAGLFAGVLSVGVLTPLFA